MPDGHCKGQSPQTDRLNVYFSETSGKYVFSQKALYPYLPVSYSFRVHSPNTIKFISSYLKTLFCLLEEASKFQGEWLLQFKIQYQLRVKGP